MKVCLDIQEIFTLIISSSVRPKFDHLKKTQSKYHPYFRKFEDLN